MPSLLDLPGEVVESIVELLDPASRAAAAASCVALRRAVGGADARSPAWERSSAAAPAGAPLPHPTIAVAACPSTGAIAVACFEMTGPRIWFLGPRGEVECERRIPAGAACMPHSAAWTPGGDALVLLLTRPSPSREWSAWIASPRARSAPPRAIASSAGGDADLSPLGEVAWTDGGRAFASSPAGAPPRRIDLPTWGLWDRVRWSRSPGGPLAARDARSGRVWIAAGAEGHGSRRGPPTALDSPPAAVGDGWLVAIARLRGPPFFLGPDGRLRGIEPADGEAAEVLEEILGLAPEAAGPGWVLAPTRCVAGRPARALRLDPADEPGARHLVARAVSLPMRARAPASTLGPSMRARWDAAVPGLAVARCGLGPRLVRFW